MKNLKTMTSYAAAYIMWILSFLLWLYFMILSRSALMTSLSLYYVQTNFQRRMETQFIDRAYIFFTGAIWLILMVFTEHYFRTAVSKGMLFRRIGIILGPEAALVFVSDLAMAWMVGFGIMPWQRWLQLAIELGAAAGFIWLAVKGPVTQPIQKPYLGSI